MPSTTSRAFALLCALAAPLAAQEPQQGSRSSTLMLRYASFDPLAGQPATPVELTARGDQRLHIVQYAATPTQADRDRIAEFGGQVVHYLPHHAYVVRIDGDAVPALRGAAGVRWVGHYHPAYRLDPALLAARAWQAEAAVRYDMVVADKRRDKPALAAGIRAIGGRVDDEHTGSLMFSATLTGPQLLQVAAFDQVLWIDPWTPIGLDMDNVRIQGGGNYIEGVAGYSGANVKVHIYEGIEATHPDFTGGATVVNSSTAAQTHGHATAGIVFGNGTSNPAVRGMAPDATKFFTNYSTATASRWQTFSDLVNVHGVSHTTASWGNGLTTAYTTVSAEADDITFDHDIAWTQSQSNDGTQNSRPQAWAKNVLSIGAVYHFNDSNPANDSWNGGASIGPASDGRLKPTLCAYYDQTGTSDLTGADGYTSTDWYASFGGTSGATPIVAGHDVLAIQMFTDESATPGFGRFGNQLRAPGAGVHANRPHAPTLKALQVVNARQYSFNAGSVNNRREHQGWGFPSLQDMWDERGSTFLVDETDVLTQGQARSWAISVAVGEPSLKVCLNWLEPAANPASLLHLINNLSLRVTSPSGTVYWGNNGLTTGVWSVAGGSEDTINSIENVFVQNPQAGLWNVEVLATAIVADNHVETPAVDADYALVVRGGTGSQAVLATFHTFGQGCPGSVVLPVSCPQLNAGGGALTNDVRDNEYCYQVVNTGALTVNSFAIWTASTGGTVGVPAHIYASAGGVPAATPLGSTTVTVGAAPGFYTATFNPPVAVNGTFYLGFDTTAQNAYISILTAGQTGVGFYRDPPNGQPNWLLSALVTRPSWLISCSGPGTPLTPTLGNVGTPKLGQSYSVTLVDALDNTFAVLASGLSDSNWAGVPLPVTLPGAPGCDLLIDPLILDPHLTGPGMASGSFLVPNDNSLVGLPWFHQWAVLDPANALGLVLSNAGRASIGN